MQLILNNNFPINCKKIVFGIKKNNLYSIALFVNEYNIEVFDYLNNNSNIQITTSTNNLLFHFTITNKVVYDYKKNLYSIEGEKIL